MFDVLIIGGGPVGLLMANLLAEQGLMIALVEKRKSISPKSKAIGITPPSLEILNTLTLGNTVNGDIANEDIGLGDVLIKRGQRIKQVLIYGEDTFLDNTTFLGKASLDKAPSPLSFILSCPQYETMNVLKDKLMTYENVNYLSEVHYLNHFESQDKVITTCYSSKLGTTVELKSKWLIGADGGRSSVRGNAGLESQFIEYGEHFIMGDFMDEEHERNEAHLYFTSSGAVESFPLPNNIRRWIVQTDKKETAFLKEKHIERVSFRTKIDFTKAKPMGFSSFSPYGCVLKRIYKGRVILCGDAAHVVSPIGGQGMNAGFGDVEWLSKIIPEMIKSEKNREVMLNAYNEIRNKSVQVSRRTAHMGMWTGTRKGKVLNLVRNNLLRFGLNIPFLIDYLMGYFSMRKTPNSRFSIKTLLKYVSS